MGTLLQQPPIGVANGPPSEQFNCVQPRLQPERKHTSAFVSICQHSSAYVNIRQHMASCPILCSRVYNLCCKSLHTSACVVCVSIRQHMSVYGSIRQHASYTSAYVSMLQHMFHMSAYAQPLLQPLLQVSASVATHRGDISRTKLLQDYISATKLLQTLKLVLLKYYKTSN